MTVYILVYVFLNCPVRTLIISWIEGNYLIFVKCTRPSFSNKLVLMVYYILNVVFFTLYANLLLNSLIYLGMRYLNVAMQSQ